MKILPKSEAGSGGIVQHPTQEPLKMQRPLKTIEDIADLRDVFLILDINLGSAKQPET
jgi:hypothetical protein